MVSGQLYKNWLQKVYKENLEVMRFWLENDLISEQQYLVFVQLGDTIAKFPVKYYQ